MSWTDLKRRYERGDLLASQSTEDMTARRVLRAMGLTEASFPRAEHELGTDLKRTEETTLLERVRTTAPLFELAPQERRNELAGCFALGRSAQRLVVGKRVLLCDDIYTTGSTMAEAARVLLQAGARQVQGVALCAASHNW